MLLSELKSKLYENNVPDRSYSLNEGLKSDAIVIYKNYSKWECFYLDERGGKHDFRIFESDGDAYSYLWEKMEYQLNVFKISPRGKFNAGKNYKVMLFVFFTCNG
jgi:hypothetical protein